MSSQGSCPAGLIAEAGLRWWRRDAALNRTEDLMSKSAKKRTTALSTTPVSAAKSSEQTTGDVKSDKGDPGSKQSRMIAMLQSPTGATIAAMMQATSWQQ